MSDTPLSSLQFERAETEAAATPALACVHCSSAIHSVYYSAATATICETCYYAGTAAPEGSRAGRMVKALGAGAGVAVAGAAVYYGIREATGYEFGLVAIVLGWAIGKAVLWGSANRGGWRYQVLAVALTYLAIVATYVPYVFQGFEESVQEQEAETAKAPAAAPNAADAPKVNQAAAVTAPTGGEIVAGLALLGGILLAAPFLGGFENIIGILIILFGLFEAWKITKATGNDITGPYRVGETG
ncbi:MAG TPA: hypothetical protein VEK11_24840 [Thermoanaerobaculia bacterium]|jgi:hypothetical protein|nr:hypothetical protein [Thermoanaerobaculia bacterium]